MSIKPIVFFAVFIAFFSLQFTVFAQNLDDLLAKYSQLQKELRESQNYKPPKNQPRHRPNTPAPKVPREAKVIKQDLIKTALSLASIYFNPQEPNFREALYYSGETSRIAQEIGDFSSAALAHRTLGDHYSKYAETALALKNYIDAAKFYKDSKKYDIYIEVLIKIARLHTTKKDNNRAIAVLSQCIKEAETYNQPSKKIQCYELLSQIYSVEGDKENADKYKRLSKGQPDKEVAVAPPKPSDDERAIEEAKQKLEEEKKAIEAQKALLQQQEREKLEAMDREKAALEAQIKSGNVSAEKAEDLYAKIERIQYERSKKEKALKDSLRSMELSLQAKQLELEASETKRKEKEQQIYFLSAAGVAFLLVFIIIIVSALSIRKANRKLAAQNAEILKQAKEIEQQKALIEEEKNKSDKLLLNILPQAVADELKTKGYAVPEYYDQVTVMFGDIKGFTNIAEKLTPREVIEELNLCFTAFDAICEKHHLERIKTIGDAYMCAGGVPKPNSTNALDAVLAALEMQQFMKDLKEKKEMRGEPFFELRIGIHTGAVIAGVVGTKKFAYDIWGDTVNLASRMESSGEVGMVNISEETYKLVKNDIYCAYRGEIPAKNKGNVAMYFAVEKW
jgi:class 3 adenylate cyclase